MRAGLLQSLHVKRMGMTTRGTPGCPAALESARYFYFWRFS
jgi:hypothetical protein